MIALKAKKWSEKQKKENGVKFPLPYEIHITIQGPGNIEQFQNVCKQLKVKPIVIDLQKNEKVIMQDVMTSSVHYGDNRSAYDAAEELRYDLSMKGYCVLRVKIETVPWHPAAPSKNDRVFVMPDNSYFESHLRIVTTVDKKRTLETIAKNYGAHLSRNFFKKINDDEYVIMMTLRSTTDNREDFKSKVEALKWTLTSVGFEVDKMEIEFAVYDTKISHDKDWIEGKVSNIEF